MFCFFVSCFGRRLWFFFAFRSTCRWAAAPVERHLAKSWINYKTSENWALGTRRLSKYWVSTHLCTGLWHTCSREPSVGLTFSFSRCSFFLESSSLWCFLLSLCNRWRCQNMSTTIVLSHHISKTFPMTLLNPKYTPSHAARVTKSQQATCITDFHVELTSSEYQ